MIVNKYAACLPTPVSVDNPQQALPSAQTPVQAPSRARCTVCDCIVDVKKCAVCTSIDRKCCRGSVLTPHTRFAELRGRYDFYEVLLRKGVTLVAQ